MSTAQSFIGTMNALDVLGWGVSGFVFLSPDLMTAIKVHHNSEGFHTEVKAYGLLRRHRIRNRRDYNTKTSEIEQNSSFSLRKWSTRYA